MNFYVYNIQYLISSTASDGMQSDTETAYIWTNHYSADHLTMHFVDDAGNKGGGQASIPHIYPFLKSSWVSTYYADVYGTPSATFVREVGATIAHELGHNLGLWHTHHKGRSLTAPNNGATNNCYQESVSRTKEAGIGCLFTHGEKKCEVNGDFMCDTAADPGMSDMDDYNSNTCTYTYPPSGDYRVDNWGDLWVPHARNVMGYGNGSQLCRNYFSPGQIAAMNFYTETYPSAGTSISGTGPLCYNIGKTFTAPHVANAMYIWEVEANMTIESGQGTEMICHSANMP